MSYTISLSSRYQQSTTKQHMKGTTNGNRNRTMHTSGFSSNAWTDV